MAARRRGVTVRVTLNPARRSGEHEDEAARKAWACESGDNREIRAHPTRSVIGAQYPEVARSRLGCPRKHEGPVGHVPTVAHHVSGLAAAIVITLTFSADPSHLAISRTVNAILSLIDFTPFDHIGGSFKNTFSIVRVDDVRKKVCSYFPLIVRSKKDLTTSLVPRLSVL